MGLRPKIHLPKHKSSKSSKSQKDKPPPVFINNHATDDLLKGHKALTSSPKPAAPKPVVIASTALWIASANAEAHKPTKRDDSFDSYGNYSEEIEESEFFEEEIIEEDEVIEEEVIDDALPPRKITIQFDEYDEMQTVLHINDYSNHEISKAWFKRQDYDKMVTLARKTAQKAEERMKELGKLSSKKGQKRIESRGLEAWTPVGATKTKMLKESAVEAVWNEQSRQWDIGVTDWDKIRQVYQTVSKGAQKAANDRALSDALIVKQIRQMDQLDKEKKKNRKLLGKTKALVGKTARVTTGGVVKTAKLAGRTTKKTGKIALGTAKVAKKTAVATATLDRKMLKEAIIPGKKKRECARQIVRRPSLSSMSNHDKVEGKLRPPFLFLQHSVFFTYVLSRSVF